MTLGANDFVLTPNGTWHEHGVESTGTPCIWQDGLDIPLVNAMEANFYEVHPDLHQAVGFPVDDPTATWSGTALLPHQHGWAKPYSPLFKYEWAPTYEALRKLARVREGSPFDGLLMHYTNPLTGGPVMPTIGASMQLLPPGFHGQAHRHTGSFLYQVAKGQGYSVIGGRRFDWRERDIFCVPSWMWHEHVNTSASDDACLFCFSDLPVRRCRTTAATSPWPPPDRPTDPTTGTHPCALSPTVPMSMTPPASVSCRPTRSSTSSAWLPARARACRPRCSN